MRSTRVPTCSGVALQQSIQADSVAIAKAAFGPKLNAIGDWEVDNPRFGGGGGNDWMAAASKFSLDLFDGGARVRATPARARPEAGGGRAARRRLPAACGSKCARLTSTTTPPVSQLEVARTAVGQAGESLRIGHDRYDAGLNTITDLLRMEEADVRAQTDYWQAVYRVQSSYANLELATGTLSANSPVVKQ